MQLLKDAPAWNKDSAEKLQDFLNSQFGQTFLANLIALRPSLSGSTDNANEVSFQSKLVQGYELALSRILRLSRPDPSVEIEEVSAAYPELDDDSKWPVKPKS